MSSTALLTSSCSNSDTTWMSVKEILDKDHNTCSNIPNGTFNIFLHLYQKIRGITSITLVTRNSECTPPLGYSVSIAYCDKIDKCDYSSVCYPQAKTIQGECKHLCKWTYNIMANELLISPNGNNFQLCEVIVENL